MRGPCDASTVSLTTPCSQPEASWKLRGLKGPEHSLPLDDPTVSVSRAGLPPKPPSALPTPGQAEKGARLPTASGRASSGLPRGKRSTPCLPPAPPPPSRVPTPRHPSQGPGSRPRVCRAAVRSSPVAAAPTHVILCLYLVSIMRSFINQPDESFSNWS